jgi:arylsulfatase A-like enzyme
LCIALLPLVVVLSCGRESTQPNVVLLVIDALRPDHLSCYGYGRPTSPNIDEIAATGVVFENAVCHAPWTKSSFSSMLTSLYPFQHGVVDWASVMPDTLRTLPEVLAQAGYSTACVMNTVALSGEYRVLAGFDRVVVTEKEDRDAFKTSDDAIELMKGMSEPFFLMVHYSDVHTPYRPPMKYVDLVRTGDDVDPYSRLSGYRAGDDDIPPPDVIAAKKHLYDGCIRLADDGVARLINYLAEAGIAGRTVLVVTADHGEAFWEHGAAFHAGSVYEEVMRVPLVMSYPPVLPEGKSIAEQVRHIDLLPTILDITETEDHMLREGGSLLDLAGGGTRHARKGAFLPAEAALCECTRPRAPATRCIRLDGWKFIVESITATTELYNLNQDPGETTDLSACGHAMEDSLSSMLSRVPGIRLGGWRVALPGAGQEVEFRVTVSLPGEGRFASVERFAPRPETSLEMDADSTRFKFDASGQDLNPLVFRTDPVTAEVEFSITAEGPSSPVWVQVGEAGRREIGKDFALRPEDGMGLPTDFLEAKEAGAVGAYVWWFPGEDGEAKRTTVDLTPEQKQRLRSLGYIQ